jgi:AhpD family alkylhydroperoxidase
MSYVNVTKVFPGFYEAQMAVETASQEAVTAAGLDPLLVDLVKLRASQLNGCAFCLRMHAQDAVKNGETAERLAVVAAWWESQYFTAQEQAALTLAEQITLIGSQHTSPAPKVDVAAALDEKQIAAITTVAIAINGWNRIAISSGYPVAP